LKPAQHKFHQIPLAAAATSQDSPQLIHLRDGEVVLYRRDRSRRWQARFKLYDRKWRRVSTGHNNLEYAAQAACEAYDLARFKERLGLPQATRRFDHVARAAVVELQNEITTGIGKKIYKDYILVINKYLVPFFEKQWITSIDAAAVKRFEAWRNQRMGRMPKSSTLLTHAAALSRIFEVAVQRGWLSDRHLVPRLNTRGLRSEARPAFAVAEVQTLLDFMRQWITQSSVPAVAQMRELLRDYVEVLLHTGMRHGTESINLKWCHIDIYNTRAELPYIRMWVSGKTGPRHLIARHEVIPALERIRNRFSDLAEGTLQAALERRHDVWVFRLPNGHRPPSLNGTFRRLMLASGMLKGPNNTNRTLYSLRHTYATLALTSGIGVHELARQMGTSVAMLERHYSKLTPELVAERFGGQPQTIRGE